MPGNAKFKCVRALSPGEHAMHGFCKSPNGGKGSGGWAMRSQGCSTDARNLQSQTAQYVMQRVQDDLVGLRHATRKCNVKVSVGRCVQHN